MPFDCDNEMKMLPLIFAGLFLTFFSSIAVADVGEKLFKQHCSVCHGEPAAGQPRVAPPIFAIKNHYLAVHDEELTFVSAIEEWVANPLEKNSLMKGAIRHFKLMPKISVPEADVTTIAEYIFSDKVDIPEIYKKHYQANHGGQSAIVYSRILLRQFRISPQQIEELKLTVTQLDKINQLIVDKEVIMQPMREEVLAFNQQLQSLDSRKPNFASEIETLADINAKRVEQMVLASGAARAKIEAVLDDKQYQIYMKFREALFKQLKRR